MVRQGVLTRAVLGLSACALTALVYVPFLDSPFVLDDRTAILLNPSLVDLSDVRGILLYDRWHPLATATLALDRATSGISPLDFHVTNGVLHVAVVALIFALASRPRRGQTGVNPGSDGGQTTFDVRSRGSGSLLDSRERTGRTWAAFVAAATFGANPLTARTAAYISARADLLFCAGILLAGMLAWGAARAGSGARLAVAAFVALLALTSIPIGTIAVHGPPRLYLTAAVVLLAAARTTHSLFARARAVRVGGVLVVATLALFTRQTLTRWADPVALWREEITRTPNAWDAHLGYAHALREASRCPEAAAEYDAVLRLRPGEEEARRGLAWCGTAR